MVDGISRYIAKKVSMCLLNPNEWLTFSLDTNYMNDICLLKGTQLAQLMPKDTLQIDLYHACF